MSQFYHAISAACLLYIVYTIMIVQRTGIPISLLPDNAYMPAENNGLETSQTYFPPPSSPESPEAFGSEKDGGLPETAPLENVTSSEPIAVGKKGGRKKK